MQAWTCAREQSDTFERYLKTKGSYEKITINCINALFCADQAAQSEYIFACEAQKLKLIVFAVMQGKPVLKNDYLYNYLKEIPVYLVAHHKVQLYGAALYALVYSK